MGKGTGLGLSISDAIIRDHDGTLTASNAPAGGAVFRITLPVPRDLAADFVDRRGLEH